MQLRAVSLIYENTRLYHLDLKRFDECVVLVAVCDILDFCSYKNEGR